MKQIKIMFICAEIAALFAILHICMVCAKDGVFNYEHAFLISVFSIFLPVLQSLQQSINWYDDENKNKKV